MARRDRRVFEEGERAAKLDGQGELDAERAVSDPLPRFLADPRAAALTEEKIAEIDAAILAEIDRGFEVTYAAADPTPDKLYTDVYIQYGGRLQ